MTIDNGASRVPYLFEFKWYASVLNILFQLGK